VSLILAYAGLPNFDSSASELLNPAEMPCGNRDSLSAALKGQLLIWSAA
jgi:hypothetical protein